jgi:hypothetical protein
MGGFVIDIYVGFILRWGIITWRKMIGSKWPVVTGIIMRCSFERPGYGGDYVIVEYEYQIDSARFQGVLKRPYLFPEHATAFVRRHRADAEIKVHLDPKFAAHSFPVLV